MINFNCGFALLKKFKDAKAINDANTVSKLSIRHIDWVNEDLPAKEKNNYANGIYFYFDGDYKNEQTWVICLNLHNAHSQVNVDKVMKDANDYVKFVFEALGFKHGFNAVNIKNIEGKSIGEFCYKELNINKDLMQDDGSFLLIKIFFTLKKC